MDKKQLKKYAKKLEDAIALGRIAYVLLGGFIVLKFFDWFTNTTMLSMASILFVGLWGMLYFYLRAEWRELFASP